MSEVIVNSTICGFVHHIRGELKGDKIAIDIDTNCDKIKKMSPMEVPIKEIFDIKENYVVNRAQELQCSSNCLVPCGILNICRLESGLLSKFMAKQCGSISIEFK